MAASDMFNLRVVFTGICSLVTDKPLGSSPAELHVVLPDAWDVNRTTAYLGMDDKKKLVRHGAFVKIPLRNLGIGDTLGSILWYPKRHKLDFGFTGGAPLHTSGLAGVADMAVIASKFPHVGQGVLGSDPVQEILANASFTKGVLTAEPGNLTAIFEDALKQDPGAVTINQMSYRVVLKIDGIQDLTIKATPFTTLGAPRDGNPGSGDAAEIQIVPVTANEDIEIVIANACDVNPLDWRADDATATTDDADFKWHYEILSEQRTDVKRELGTKPLPFPKLAELGNGRNCFPAFWVI